MRKHADAHVAPCPTFVAIFANLTTSARRTPSNRLPPSEFSLIEVASLPASFAVLIAAFSASESPGDISPEMAIMTLPSFNVDGLRSAAIAILPTDANTIPAVKHHLITIPLDPESGSASIFLQEREISPFVFNPSST
jgi:hypothetical protein